MAQYPVVSSLAAAIMVLASSSCDAGIESRARAAIERRDSASAPGPTLNVLNAHAEEMARTSQAYELALTQAGYTDALAERALTSTVEFAKGAERIAAAKAAASEHAIMALAQTDRVIEQLTALKVTQPNEAERISSMLTELSAMRARRAAHWAHAQSIVDETLGAWHALNNAQGEWGLEADGLKFTRLKDREAYDSHAAKISAHVARQKRIMTEQSKSAAKLMALSEGKGA